MYGIMKTSFFFLIISVFLFSCSENESSFEIISFNSITNKEFKTNDSVINLSADLTDAAVQGIVIPSAKQTASGGFVFDFTIKRKDESRERLFYKIYYQNETYKWPNTHELSNENFYGSWEDVNIGFKPIPTFQESITIEDSFRIVGNPRDEYIYYGSNPNNFIVSDTMIAEKKAIIKGDPSWYGEIVKKAEKQKISPEEQLHLDALWALDYDRNSDKSYNNRWRRNPRMGEYKFMIVVVNEKELRSAPKGVKILKLLDQDQRFTNPFSYFETTNKGIAKKVADKKLKLNAKMDLGSGVYIGKTGVNKSVYSTAYYNENCSDHAKMYRKAHFQQYFHYINRDFPLKNISEVIDVMEPSFTREKYETIKKQYEASNKFIDTYVNSSDCPCKTVISDSVENSITLINPGNKEGEYKKEHVGVVGRIGFTYGKWRAKIKFPELINQHNVWNGVTNAFWLLAQEGDSDWNLRRPCNADIGYIPKGEGDNEEALKKSKKQSGYSEIDFEILKESQYWPQTSYNDKSNFPKEDPSKTNDITVTCTNWDLACHEPKNFDIGAKVFTYNNKSFVVHRWNHWYKALTTKVPVKSKELFGSDYYYFEIEWTPEKIIWRIGPEKDKLAIISVMTNEISAIPNNQMSALVTQEWHNQEWWPTAPFKQNFVPFPKKDIVGKVLEIEIE